MKTHTETHSPSDLMIESSIDTMIAIGTDELVISWNSSATILFDRIQDEVLGKSLFYVLPSLKNDSSLRTAIHWAMEGKKSYLPSSDDFPHRKHVEIHVIPLCKHRVIEGVMLLIHDVSHRIANERELQRVNEELQNRVRQLHIMSSEFAQLTHVASHNIRGPIREIYTLVEQLLRSEARVMSGSGRASFRRMQSSLNRMNILLDDIITLSQINIAERPDSFINISELVNEIRIQFEKKLEESKTVLTTGELNDIIAHRNQILLLLQQIFLNVIKFTAPDPPRINVQSSKTLYSKTNDDKHTQEYFLLSVTHNSSVFDEVDSGKKLDVSNGTDMRNYTGPAIAMIIAARIMEAHSGFLVMEKSSQKENKIDFFFPANNHE